MKKVFKYARLNQTYSEYTLNQAQKSYMPKYPDYRSLIPHEADLDEREFFSSSSDFDPHSFSLRNYLYEAIFQYKPTLIKGMIFLVFWYSLYFVVVCVYKTSKQILFNFSPISHYKMLEPAIIDMNITRYRQRLLFKTLHKFD